MKILYFRDSTTIAVTLMIVVLLGFILYSIFTRSQIKHWGKRSFFVFLAGLEICCLAATRDGFHKTVQAAIDSSCAPGIFSLTSIPSIAGYIGATAILTAFIATPFSKSQHTRQLWFYAMSGGIALKVLVIEIARIVHL